jgi:hypothetical protein
VAWWDCIRQALRLRHPWNHCSLRDHFGNLV